MSRYAVWIHEAVRDEIEVLPGNMRQRVRKAITALRDDPCPPTSKVLTLPEDIEPEVRRIRMDPWRIVYAVDEEERAVARVCGSQKAALRLRGHRGTTEYQTTLSSIDSHDRD
jgi:mRNA-degrading endonuclease RelE of RelBE toxin-antitoxin system